MKDTGNTIGRNAPDGTVTTATAAFLVNRSVDTLRRWHKKGEFVPSSSMQAGQLTVFLYTDEDIQKLKEFARRQRPGRKKQSKSSKKVRIKKP